MADEPSVMEEALAEAQKLQNQLKTEENASSSENETGQATVPNKDTDDNQQVEQPEIIEYKQILDEQGRSYSTGKRKDATARVWLKPGSGKIEMVLSCPQPYKVDNIFNMTLPKSSLSISTKLSVLLPGQF